MQTVGPLKLIGPEVCDEVFAPLATFETPLFPSVNRGARVSARAGGINVVVDQDCMTRSVLFEAASAAEASRAAKQIQEAEASIADAIQATSRFATLSGIHCEIVGRLIFVRIAAQTGDAAGHNMVTLAAQHVMDHVLAHHPELKHVSVSGNYCTDKKASAVNGILGRGKRVIAETTISPKLCKRFLKSTPAEIAALNTKKNLIGTVIAGGVRTANAHFANMLLAFYLATGQDAANIVEGSQGITYAEATDEGLYFSVTVPNIIVGTVGNGKDRSFVRENLELLGCRTSADPGANARRLAAIAGAVVLCGELSLLAALTNPGELMAAHTKFERED